MDIQEARRQYDEASSKLKEALDDKQKIEDGLRASEARRVAGLREAEKIEVEESTKVFEALGMPKAAAEFAARGRAA